MSLLRASLFAASLLAISVLSSGCDVISTPRINCLAQYRGNYAGYAQQKSIPEGVQCPPIPPSDDEHMVSVPAGGRFAEQGRVEHSD
jgi:hypothetical protein